ncbi:MAG: GNAT family N-acetyltransferase [Acidobacteria bacterium]|nr:GNAT family N-acetyltransferase [Acidobacteriota bacterium]MCA1639843.1 GNAT family N-acetyltransferase [Acidobacteriota bacterium]
MVDQNFRVRPIEEKDISEWFRLRKLLWDESSDDEHKTEMLGIYANKETQLVLVAEISDGKLVGFLEASIRPFVEDCHSDHVGYLEGWFVVPEYRKQGIGRKLVKAAESWARVKGCEEMASDSEIGNNLSLVAHLNLGYEETSRLVHLRKDLV